jgi:energy-coupling factor transporter ATP-binding protein EcfA2
MVTQTRCRPATAQRHLQGIANQLRIEMLAHRPPHNLSRIQVQKHRRIQSAFLGPDVRHITAPRYIR